ncbi:MAG: DUF362 domain-containing protein [Syntrophales bacterium]|nr:DUF362 domain-containing protein [Syntrophales bacterium]
MGTSNNLWSNENNCLVGDTAFLRLLLKTVRKLDIALNRRDFLRFAVFASSALWFEFFAPPISALGRVKERPDIVVAQGKSPTLVTRAAVNAIGGMERFISRDDVVVVKPNIGWDRTPEYAANTNPEVVAAIVRMCYEAGAKKVKVFDRSVAHPQRCYKRSGIADAVSAVGGVVSFIDERRFREVKLPGYAFKTWPLYMDVIEADKIINVPVAKTHGLTGLTLGMKNWLGIMGGWRGLLHQRINESIVDVSLTVKPVLVVLDAVRILVANGPQGGDLSDVVTLNTVVVGTDQVAVDAFGASLFGMKGRDIGYIRLGHEARLGTMDIGKLKISRVYV